VAPSGFLPTRLNEMTGIIVQNWTTLELFSKPRRSNQALVRTSRVLPEKLLSDQYPRIGCDVDQAAVAEALHELADARSRSTTICDSS